jgi:hypothetical protein
MINSRPDSHYNKWQLRTGIKIEAEHRVTPAKAKSIAKDHLDEFPDYYTHLVRMEKFLASKRHKQLVKAHKDYYGGVF